MIFLCYAKSNILSTCSFSTCQYYLHTAQIYLLRLGNWHLCTNDETIKNLVLLLYITSTSLGVFWWGSSKWSRTCTENGRCLNSHGSLFLSYVESSLNFSRNQSWERELIRWGEKNHVCQSSSMNCWIWTIHELSERLKKSPYFALLDDLLIYFKLLVDNNGIF